MKNFAQIAAQGFSLSRKFIHGKPILPRFAPVYLDYPNSRVEIIKDEIHQLLTENLAGKIREGMNVAVAVGSRGIEDLPIIVQEIICFLMESGARPFIVPAMGSHGKSTGKGQKELLYSLGLRPNQKGVEIRSSMKVKYLGDTPHGVPVYIDRHAYESDGIIVVNRVREHTDFDGPIQSGLMKMLAVGLGKSAGANAIHERGAGEMHVHIPAVARKILESGWILLGIAIVENASGQICMIRGAPPDQFEDVDKELLIRSLEHTPRLPVDSLDVLVVQVMGKDISGSGMDFKTVGRRRIPGVPEPPCPEIERIVVLDMTPASQGNATGLYLADITTKSLVSKIDFDAFYINQLYAAHLEGGKIPIIMASDYEAIVVAMCLGWKKRPEAIRSIIIKDTKHMNPIFVSEALLPELENKDNVLIQNVPSELRFSNEGKLLI